MIKRKRTAGVLVILLLLLILGGCVYLFTGTRIKDARDEVTKGNAGTTSLVVYFSREGEIPGNVDAVSAATANSNQEMSGSDTQAAAKMIETLTGADLYQIRTEEYYRKSFWGTAARAWLENTFHLRPRLAARPDDLYQYDTIYIGYPIWWFNAPMAVGTFLESYDLSGKTVIPFCTSASSGLGESGNLLEEMAGTGNWQEGQRFSSGASEEDVTSWVESLNLN